MTEQNRGEASPVYVGGHLPPGVYVMYCEYRDENGVMVSTERRGRPPFELPSGVEILDLRFEANGLEVALYDFWGAGGRVHLNPGFEEAPRLGERANLRFLREAEGWHGDPFGDLPRAPKLPASAIACFTSPRRHYRRERQAGYRARRKARMLLRRFCTPEQWAEYVREKRLTVETERSVFVLTQVISGGVEQTPRSRLGVPLRHQSRKWCVHTPYGFPVEDMILAQKLAIENDEASFLRRANPAFGFGWGGYREYGFFDDPVDMTWGDHAQNPPPEPAHTTTRIMRLGGAAQPAIDALETLGGSAAALAERAMAPLVVALDRVRIGRPPRAELGSCCENDETHEQDGNWCRRAFRRFFEPIVEEGRLSIEEAREASRQNRSPVPVGSERRRE